MTTKSICLCLKTSGCHVVKVDAEQKSLLSQEDKTLANSRMWSILKRNFTTRLIYLLLVLLTITKAFNLGKSTEILRDELKFTKFIGRLRKRFGQLFHDILKTQLILKGIITPEDWDDMEEHIQYDFLFDNHFNELKEQEMMMQRITLATQMDPFVGKYFSTEYIRRKILKQTENEYKEIDSQMQNDIDSGMAIDPVQVNMLTDLEQQNKAFQPELQSAEADAAAERK